MKNLFFVLFIFTLFGLGELQTGPTGGSTSGAPPTGGSSTGRPTSSRPRLVSCYQCSYTTCPRPFTRFGVTTALSGNGWCAKMTSSPNDNMQPATRTVDPGNCAARGSNGCRWETVQGTYTYLCCCNRDGCNSANLNSYSKYFLLFVVLLSTIIKKY